MRRHETWAEAGAYVVNLVISSAEQENFFEAEQVHTRLLASSNPDPSHPHPPAKSIVNAAA